MSAWGAKVLPIGVGVSYFVYYVLFTGVIDQNELSPFSPSGAGFYLVGVASSTYTGPGLEIVNGSSLVLVRIVPLVISAVLSVAVALNLSMLYGLYRTGGLMACLRLGGTAGIGAVVANLASFSYLCCGWAASLAIVGSTVLAPFSIYIGIAITILLLLNALLLRRRQLAFNSSGKEVVTK